MKPLFERCKDNPIITVDDLPVPASAVYNPGAAMFGEEVVLSLRVEDRAGFSSIYLARSDDGMSGWRIEPKPFLAYGEADYPYEEFGCEDARITHLAEDDRYYICYVAYSALGPAPGLAYTDDFERVERAGLMLSPTNKDAVMFPRKIRDRYTVLHRPEAGGEHIWSAQSPDLYHWGMPHCVLVQRGGPSWDNAKVGAGPPPIETKDGWLLIYHGVKQFGSSMVYRVGLALLDLEPPHEVTARSPGWVFGAQEPYELSGILPNVVFPSGAIVRGDELWMYYGAADTCVCVATARVADLLAALHG
jgi:predicted GH43/DUF377 family glycosyl hydrolase